MSVPLGVQKMQSENLPLARMHEIIVRMRKELDRIKPLIVALASSDDSVVHSKQEVEVMKACTRYVSSMMIADIMLEESVER